MMVVKVILEEQQQEQEQEQDKCFIFKREYQR